MYPDSGYTDACAVSVYLALFSRKGLGTRLGVKLRIWSKPERAPH